MSAAPVDVVVVGAGAIGLATALALVEAGRQVHVLDAGAVGAATSYGNCGTITPSHAPPLAAPGMIAQALKWMLTPDAPLYIRPRLDPTLWRWLLQFAQRCNTRHWQASAQARAALLGDARQRFDDWVERYALDCEFRSDGLDYVFADARRFAHYRHECGMLAQWGIQAEMIEGADYVRQDPAFRAGIAGAIHFPGDAHLRPERYTAELARVLRARGAVIQAQCRVDAVVPDACGACVHTARGRLQAREVVIATGPWSPLLAAQLGLRLPVQAGKGYSITYTAPALMPRRPVVLKDRWVFVVPWRDRLRIGSTMEFSGHDTHLNPTRLAALERAAADYLHTPAGPAVIERWYGWRPMTWDDVPVLGAVPGRPHVWLAAGHGMLGISMSTASGQLMADLITGRAPALDPHPFRAERFA
ncbi:NAD(P)/FAD-dependent oxidoreductase [Xanthomonas arboricola pv. juglandis]|uniref:NAD(P)/FAD-dependent oxidoreductase n=1 Tax=Xanthomonas arboricola TaxID=56448 RepID=UPI00063E8554|nr:FAD-dependent oxidoreductase [Xanthomonas arboricola]AKU50328.1 amino acid dehydrogenase [Xanthomonas arboricola pv. juglandis]KOA97906.1 amino acid dehydrogenase [Xanthomonas arboricola]KOB07102.1 amino acid dehydrogenase [Xanthomonas arboricola]KOB09299.1 amino acid dehydrogenase [Xanthomonas arboricola]KOB17955.1 amino acid dehydrogenase [Xanthomonas arboricola]